MAVPLSTGITLIRVVLSAFLFGHFPLCLVGVRKVYGLKKGVSYCLNYLELTSMKRENKHQNWPCVTTFLFSMILDKVKIKIADG